MDGIMDLSSETFNELENIPTATGRGWLASNLKRDDWTVELSDGALKEIATMADECVQSHCQHSSGTHSSLKYRN